MAITKVYNVVCDRCEERYPGSHPEEDVLSLWVRLHDEGWRQAPSDNELPFLVVCPKCAAREKAEA